MAKGKKLDPIISEFETQEEADEYDRWFREKIQKAIDDPRPGIPHDEAMAQIKRTIAEIAARSPSARSKAGKLDPIVSEFESQQDADEYDRWLETVLEEAIDDPRPSIPHDEAMALVDRRLREISPGTRKKA
jgi:hypothetical protein